MDSKVQPVTPLWQRWKFRARPRSQVALSTKKRRVMLLGLLGLLLLLTIISIGVGAVTIAPSQVLSILGHHLGLQLPWEYSAGQQAVLDTIRAPRVILGILVGASMAVSGAAMQGLFRNPLADPALIGVSSGAALAAVAVIVLGATLLKGLSDLFGLYTLPLAAFGGGFVATLLVYRFSVLGGRTVVATMLLAGIAINALAGAVTGLLTYIANDEQLRTLTFWSMGSLGGATWERVTMAAPFILIPTLLIPFHARALNAILLGESEAVHLGFNIERIKFVLILLVALCVGAAVSVSGIIGFVGLVVPHLLRLAMGPDHRFILPASAMLGASLMLAADMMARVIVEPAELPIGIITAVLGGPFFLWLLSRQRNRSSW